ncbi:MAG: basic amino acid ABC transporter substrate-binding protein [Planctomycetota bacterium]|jgi:lysine-arginine-ornithine-binding protein
MHRLLIFIYLACLFLGTACAAKRDPSSVLVATEAGYPPFESDVNGEIMGFDIDLFRAVAEASGFTVEFKNQPFEGLIPGLKGGKFDAAISAMTITSERAEEVDFSDPYYDAGQVVTVREENDSIKDLSDLEGKIIAVQLGTTGFLQASKIEGVELRTFKSVEPAFLELLAGRADAVINDDPTTRLILAKEKGLKIVFGPFTEEQYGIAVRKGNAELLARINEGLKKVRDSGEYDRIREKWIPPSGK